MLQLNENKQFAFFQRLAFPLRIFLLILVFSIFVIAALAQYFTASFEDYLTLHVRDMAMNQAKIIASNDSVISAVKTRDYKRLATIANKLQRDTDFDYVVIGDRHSIRLYHPNPEKIGYPMQFTKQGALEKGESYFITGKGSMGMAMRAKTPIFDDDGKVIGVVSIGYLVSKIDSWRAEFFITDGRCVCRAVRDSDVAVVVPGRAYPSADDGHGAKANRTRGPSARGAGLVRFMKG
ncbi:sensor kinase dpiB [Escherichia coli]|uniref:Sensor kinase dpiB n=1 Tax=Escherichia coli TaxID=562 RepID=A0A376X2W3_ECOLX|nr:sensor kinase dpiB [Escherichia coli]